MADERDFRAELRDGVLMDLDVSRFMRGDPVRKVGGDYLFEGVVVARFLKASGAIRYVVEDDRGVLHIYSDKHLEFRERFDEIDEPRKEVMPDAATEPGPRDRNPNAPHVIAPQPVEPPAGAFRFSITPGTGNVVTINAPDYRAIVPVLLEALEIIAGRRQCMDNLMGNRDVAEAALAAARAAGIGGE